MEDLELEEDTGQSSFKPNLRYLWISFKRRWFWSIPVVAITTAAALFVAKNIQPSFEARTVLIKHTKNMSVNPDLYYEPSMRTILETVKLRDNLQALKEELELEDNVEDIFKWISIQQGHRNDIIQVLVTHSNPEIAAKIANEISFIFQSKTASLSRSVAQRVYEFRDSQKNVLNQKLKKAQTDMLVFLKKHNISFYKESTALVIEQIKQMEQDLNQAKIQLQKDTLRIQNIGQSLKNRPETVVVSQTLRFRDKVKVQELEKELENLREKYTDENPKVLRLQEQIASVKEDMKNAPPQPEEQSLAMDPVVESLKIEKAQLQSGLSGSTRQITALSEGITSKRKEMQKLASIQKEYDNLQRQIDLMTDNLKANENKMVEAENAMKSNISNFDIVEKAQVPERPLPTKKKLIVLAGVFAGAALGLLGVILSELADLRVKSKLDFSLLDFEHLGMLPQRDKVSPTVFYHYQNLFFNQILLRLNTSPALVLTFSQAANEGKSFVLEPLIENLNHQGKKVIFIQSISDIDTIHEPFLLNSFLQYPDREMPVPQEISKNRLHLYVDTREQSSQLPLILEKVTQLKQALGKEAPYIFWELPPLEHQLHTASILIQVAEALLCVSKFRGSPVFSLKKNLDYLKVNQIENKWGVLNHVQPSYLSI